MPSVDLISADLDRACGTCADLPDDVGCMTALEVLRIVACPKIKRKTLPRGMVKLKALKTLEIKDLPKLQQVNRIQLSLGEMRVD